MEVEIEMKKISSASLMKRPLLDTSTADSEEQPAELLTAAPTAALQQPVVLHVDPHTGAVEGGGKSSTLRASLNTIKSIVGVGILSFPFALRNAGLVFGAISVVLIALLVNYGMRLVVAVRQEVNKTRETPLSSYEEVARAVAGKWGFAAAVGAVLVTQIGIGCAYVLFVATQLHSLPGCDVLSVQLWAVAIAPVFVALCLIRNISHLAPFSAFGLVAVAFALVIVLFYGFSSRGVSSGMHLMPENYFLFFGMAVFAFEGINLAIPVHSNMERPESYGGMLNVSFVVIGVVYMSFSVLAYSFFLDGTASIIVQNLPNTWIVIVVKVCICINVLLTFPVQLFPAVLFVERVAFGSEEHSCTSPRFANFWRRNAVRTALVAGIIGLSVAIPFFEVVVSLVGGIGNGTAGFVLPAILHLMVFRGRLPVWKLALNWIVLVFGLVTSVLVTVFSIIRMVEEFQHHGAP